MDGIKAAAQKLISKHGSDDPFKIAEERNIHLVFEDLEEIYGYYHYYRRVQSIHINNKLNDILQRFVCAHELGHAIFHSKQNTAYLSRYTLFTADKLEKEANTFAVELLVNDQTLYECIRIGYNLEQIARIFGIPQQFMKYKSF
jgi:Zn-dependent peptidase ImmA (M78 family)